MIKRIKALMLSLLGRSTGKSSRQYTDRLYMVRDVQAIDGGHSNISLWSSSDKGTTWEHMADFPAGLGPGIEQRHPVVAVNKDGIVGVAWKQPREDQPTKSWEVIFTASLDGGKTFMPRLHVTAIRAALDTKSTNLPAFIGQGTMTVSQTWGSGGDYSGLTASSDGLFHLVWSDSRTGVHKIWTSSIRVSRE